MRADRLISTLLLMQARGRVTAGEIARELDISVATARRDLEALSAAGVPVYPQIGRGGGWQLLGDARTDLTGLTSVETRALFLLIGPASTIHPEARSALHKLVRALPATFRGDAEAAASSTVIDSQGWTRRQPEESIALPLLRAAVVERRQLRMTYLPWDRDAVERVIDPWGLVDKDGNWYLLGGVDGRQRTYRVDRILDVTATGAEAIRPDDFNLATAWSSVVEEVAPLRRTASATVLVDAAIVPVLVDLFGSDGARRLNGDDHYARLLISAETQPLIARKLSGWAEYLTVLEPPSLREHLARLGRQLVDRNG